MLCETLQVYLICPEEFGHATQLWVTSSHSDQIQNSNIWHNIWISEYWISNSTHFQPDYKQLSHGWIHYKHTYTHTQTVSKHKKQISHGWIVSNCILMALGTFCCHVWYCETMSALLTSGACQRWEWGANKRKYDTHTLSLAYTQVSAIKRKAKILPSKGAVSRQHPSDIFMHTIYTHKVNINHVTERHMKDISGVLFVCIRFHLLWSNCEFQEYPAIKARKHIIILPLL